MMLSCGQTEAWWVISSWICLGRRWPVRKAWSLLMNLTAMTGEGAWRGVAFLMLWRG